MAKTAMNRHHEAQHQEQPGQPPLKKPPQRVAYAGVCEGERNSSLQCACRTEPLAEIRHTGAESIGVPAPAAAVPARSGRNILCNASRAARQIWLKECGATVLVKGQMGKAIHRPFFPPTRPPTSKNRPRKRKIEMRFPLPLPEGNQWGRLRARPGRNNNLKPAGRTASGFPCRWFPA